MVPINLFIDAPAGLVPLGPENERITLPADPSRDGPRLAYGPYLRAIAVFFSRNSGENLQHLVSECVQAGGGTPALQEVRIVSEKHGALYNVCRLTMDFPAGTCSFALNAALLPDQQAFLEVEYVLLRTLHQRFGLPFLPKPVLFGKTQFPGEAGENHSLALFAAEWFEGYCEFHLSSEGNAPGGQETLPIRVWKPSGEKPVLEPAKADMLYRRAACILTSYFDTETFEQIYPWHHAAGDFVVLDEAASVDVRMITARDYRRLFPPGGGDGDGEKVLAALHFFINMTIRMRLDRLDGTGELAWAGPRSIEGVVSGFVEAWEQKEARDPELPPARDLFSLFMQLSPEERFSFAEVVVEQCQVEADERDYLSERLPAHVAELSAALDKAACQD